jgi:hypothetical protein
MALCLSLPARIERVACLILPLKWASHDQEICAAFFLSFSLAEASRRTA